MDRAEKVRLTASLTAVIEQWWQGDGKANGASEGTFYVGDGYAALMADAAMSVLDAYADHEAWAEREEHWKE